MSYVTRPVILPTDPTGPIISSVTLTTTTSEPTITTMTYSTTTSHVPPTTSTSDIPPTSTSPTTTTTNASTRTRTTRTRTHTSTTSTTSDTTTNYTTTTEPTVPPTLPPSDDGSISTGAIVGIAVAAAVALIALVFTACMVTRRRRRRRRDLTSNPIFSQPVMQENYRPGGEGGSGDGAENKGKDRPSSQDAMISSGYSNITAATGGDRYEYGPETGAVGGYAYDRQQQLEHRHGQSYSPSSNHQQVNYTPPNEPEYQQGDMYNHAYAQGRPQDDLAYHQYQQVQLYQQQMQMQQEQERLAAIAAVTGYYPVPRPSEYSPTTSHVYLEDSQQNPRHSEIEEERHLQRLQHGDPGSTGAHSSHTIPAIPSNYQAQGQYRQSVTPPRQDYVDPESDVRCSKSEPWPAPATSTVPPAPVVSGKVSSQIPASTPPHVSGRPVSMEVPRESTLPWSTGAGKRPHAPQEFPEYKRGPQVFIPESIQSIEEEDRAHQQDLMRQQSQNPQETYKSPPQ